MTNVKRFESASQSRRTPRFGIASLELVLGLPFILALGAAVLAIGFAGLHRSQAAVDARYQVWKMRNPDESHTLNEFNRESNDPLFMGSAPNAGQVSGQAKSEFETYSWLGGEWAADSKAAVLSGTWDHRQLTSFQINPGIPHLGTFGRVLGMTDGQVAVLNMLMKIALMNLDAAEPSQDVQDQVDGADDAANDAMNDIQENIDRVREELRVLREELAELQQERADIIERRDQAQDELDDLNDQLDDYDVPPQSLLNAIAAKEAEIDALNADLDAKEAEIDAKEAQIDAKEEELESWEDGMDQAQGETSDLPG